MDRMERLTARKRLKELWIEMEECQARITKIRSPGAWTTDAQKAELLEPEQQALNTYLAEYDTLNQSLEKIKPPKRIFYNARFQINLSVDKELEQAIRQDLDKGVSLTDTVRQALMVHYGLTF